MVTPRNGVRFPKTLAAVQKVEGSLRKADTDQWEIGDALLIEAKVGENGKNNGTSSILAEIANELASNGFESYRPNTLAMLRQTANAFPKETRIYDGLGFWAYYKAGSPKTLERIAKKAKAKGVKKLSRPFIEEMMKGARKANRKLSEAKIAKNRKELAVKRRMAEDDVLGAKLKLRLAKTDEDKIVCQQELEHAQAVLEDARADELVSSPVLLAEEAAKRPSKEVGDESALGVLSGVIEEMELGMFAESAAANAEKFVTAMTAEKIAGLHPDTIEWLLFSIDEAIEGWQKAREMIAPKKPIAKPNLKIIAGE